MSPRLQQRFYDFDLFRVDVSRRLLLRRGEPVPLTPKAFDILLVLVQNRDRLVEKDELMKLVWPDTVVEENNLTRNISSLRKALEEGPNEHRFVVTIPGRGYQFAAEMPAPTARTDVIFERHARARVVIEEQSDTDSDSSQSRLISPKARFGGRLLSGLLWPLSLARSLLRQLGCTLRAVRK
jgi:DNA-binding winged helix-turn-helix (wHTH) protein